MQSAASQRHTVLIVDDDTSLRSAVAVNVQVGGYDVLEAADGVEALEQLKAHDDVALVVCDIVMPKMNGADFLEQARAIRPDLPFVMITGYSSHDLMTKSLQCGAYTVLAKPFDPRTLLAIVRRAISSPIVLVVDSEDEARSVAAALGRCLIRARVVSCAADAAEALRQENVDVVIIDVGLAQLDAIEELMKKRPDVRVIGLLSGEPASPPRLGGTRAFTYLRKPVEPERLMHVLATARASP